MILMKFGGTSVGAARPFATACTIVARAKPRDPVVVVSALAGVTHLLAEFCRDPHRRRVLGGPLRGEAPLGGGGIRVEMISQGASRVNLSFVVREEDAADAVRVLHRGLGLDRDRAAVAGAEARR